MLQIAEIDFCLATTDPNGVATTGITRTQTSQTSFSINGSDMKSTSSGGIDPWNQDDYLNIWVCDLSGGILGYATPPSNFNNPEDGVVIGYKYFGTIGAVQSPYNKGRTATHEVGHWLNLTTYGVVVVIVVMIMLVIPLLKKKKIIHVLVFLIMLIVVKHQILMEICL